MVLQNELNADKHTKPRNFCKILYLEIQNLDFLEFKTRFEFMMPSSLYNP